MLNRLQLLQVSDLRFVSYGFNPIELGVIWTCPVYNREVATTVAHLCIYIYVCVFSYVYMYTYIYICIDEGGLISPRKPS